MYKNASENAQRVSRIPLAHLATGEADTNPEHLRQNLVLQWKALEADIQRTTDKAERRRLSLEKMALQERMAEIRKKAKAPAASQHFIDAARELLPRPTFNLVMAEAVKRCGLPPVEGK